MIHRVLLRVATLLTLLAFSACTGPFARLIEGSGDPTDHRREPLDVSPAIEAMRRWSEPEVVTGGFQQAWELMQNERLASVQRTLLIRTRAESLLAMAVLADIQIDLDPITAEAMYVLLASEVAVRLLAISVPVKTFVPEIQMSPVSVTARPGCGSRAPAATISNASVAMTTEN